MSSNFHFIDLIPSIDKKQVNAIKDAIFARAKEKSNALAQEKTENYTTQTQNDVMEVARESLNIPEVNPFNQFLKSMKLEAAPNTDNTQPVNDVEQPQKEVKHNIESVRSENYAESVKDETMKAARAQFRQGQSLADTLNFLNTQAAISMAKSIKPKR